MKSSGIVAAGTLGAAALALAAASAQASEHEQAVGAQVEQLCDARTLATLGRFVHVDNFREPALGQAPDAKAMVAASACRAAPAYRGRLAAAAYRSGRQDEWLLVVALIDGAGEVGPSFKGNLDSDPNVRIVSGSLWLDTAAYRTSARTGSEALPGTTSRRSRSAETVTGRALMSTATSPCAPSWC